MLLLLLVLIQPPLLSFHLLHTFFTASPLLNTFRRLTANMSKSLGLLGVLAVAAGAARADLQTCGSAQYDPASYVCHNNNFLCPIVAGEGLSSCSGACYSRFMYTCTDNVLTQLAPLAAGTPFSVTAANPAAPAVDGLAIDACNTGWNVGIKTCSYCPSEVVADCPAGNTTVLSAGDGGGVGMDVVVPGGQSVYLDPSGFVHYTQAHSASMPPGSTVGGLVAYAGGGLVNLNSGGYGWAACPSTSPTGGGAGGHTLVALTADNKDTLAYCTPVNLKVTALPAGTVGAWQYS